MGLQPAQRSPITTMSEPIALWRRLDSRFRGNDGEGVGLRRFFVIPAHAGIQGRRPPSASRRSSSFLRTRESRAVAVVSVTLSSFPSPPSVIPAQPEIRPSVVPAKARIQGQTRTTHCRP